MKDRDNGDVRPFGGLVQLQLGGDVEQAMAYQPDARKLLGRMLSVNGVEERLRNGEPGGFYKTMRLLPDGTCMTATTNNGIHTLRIETPRSTSEGEVLTHSAHADGPVNDAHHLTADYGGFEPPPLSLPGVPDRDIDEHGERRKTTSGDYMWVGVRYTTANAPWDVVGAMMIEPDTGPAYGDDGLPLRGILDSQNYWTARTFFLEGADDDWNDGGGNTFEEAVQAQYEKYAISYGDGHDHAQSHVILGTHSIPVFMNSEGVMLVSANGLRMEAISIAYDPSFTDQWLGYDPTSDTQFGDGVRELGDRQASLGQPVPLWDVVLTLDPDEDDQEYPYDDRPAMRGVRRALERIGMHTRILPGEYILALHSFDSTPQTVSRRAFEVIPLYQDDKPGPALRSPSSDYISFMGPSDTTRNLGLEVEVRLGKGENATTFRFQTSIAESNNNEYANAPYGTDWHAPCDPLGGPNPVGPNFAPQYIAINPLAGSARWVGHNEVDLYPILGGGVYTRPGDYRKPFFVYLAADPFSHPSEDTWGEYAGRVLWKVLEAATAGVYGDNLIADPGGEGGCRGIMEGSSSTMIWRYDAVGGSLTSCEAIGNMDDYPYGWIEDPTFPDGGFWSPYLQELAWYYPYKFQERDACNHSVGISVTAVYDQYYIDNGQAGHFADPPATTDCC